MNFIDAEVGKGAEPDVYTLKLGGAGTDTVLTVKRPELKDYVGKTVVVGIRPEDVHAEESWKAKDKAGNLKGICTVSELMGYERNVYMDFNGTKIISKVPVEINVQVDDQVELAIDTAKMHLFDKETENVIGG